MALTARRIVEHEQQGAKRAEYGEATLKELAEALTHEFGKGFSLTNLKMMRKFYLTYRAKIGQTASGLLQKTETLSRKSGSIEKTQTASAQFTLSFEHFLLELGKGFLFEARQKRFTFDEDHFFVDLVFYNRLLRC